MNLFVTDNKMHVTPIEFSAACDFITKFHRHHKKTVGHIFSRGCWLNGELIGVVVCGRPVSRHLDDGKTIEVTRLCVANDSPNACSKLYGAAIRTAKKKGYSKVITYTLQSEYGASLRASNFILDSDSAGGIQWTGKRKYVCKSGELKKRWVYNIKIKKDSQLTNRTHQ